MSSTPNIVNVEIPYVRIEWAVEDPQFPYMDVMEMAWDEYANVTDADIQAKQRAKYEEWKAYVTTPKNG